MSKNESPTVNRLLQALSTTTRREIVRDLQARENGEIPVSALAGSNGEKEEQIALYHRHLPKLHDAGVVTWDRKTDRIRAGPAHETAVALLETLDDVRETTDVEGH
jgi:hypothetical protein